MSTAPDNRSSKGRAPEAKGRAALAGLLESLEPIKTAAEKLNTAAYHLSNLLHVLRETRFGTACKVEEDSIYAVAEVAQAIAGQLEGDLAAYQVLLKECDIDKAQDARAFSDAARKLAFALELVLDTREHLDEKHEPIGLRESVAVARDKASRLFSASFDLFLTEGATAEQFRKVLP